MQQHGIDQRPFVPSHPPLEFHKHQCTTWQPDQAQHLLEHFSWDNHFSQLQEKFIWHAKETHNKKYISKMQAIKYRKIYNGISFEKQVSWISCHLSARVLFSTTPSPLFLLFLYNMLTQFKHEFGPTCSISIIKLYADTVTNRKASFNLVV